MASSFSNLHIFLNTVVKKVDVSDDNSTIEALYAISRQVFILFLEQTNSKPRANVECGGYDIRTSQDLVDWYTLLLDSISQLKVLSYSFREI